MSLIYQSESVSTTHRQPLEPARRTAGPRRRISADYVNGIRVLRAAVRASWEAGRGRIGGERADDVSLQLIDTVVALDPAARSVLRIVETNTKRKHDEWRTSALDTLAVLQRRFPHAFARLNDNHRRPLKVGIHVDIVAALPDLDPLAIGRALKFYVSDFKYLRACVEGAPRIDLDGNPAGVVTADEAENAARSLAGSKAKLERRREQRAAARAQSTPPAPPEKPKRLTLADLKAAVAQRKLAAQGA